MTTQHQAPEVTSDPCPFCRGTDLMPLMQDMWMKWLIGCRGCGAEGPQAETPNRAITAWNTRATQPLSLTVDEKLASSVRSLHALTVDDVAKNGPMSSTMVRAGLLLDILDRLQSLSLPVGD